MMADGDALAVTGRQSPPGVSAVWPSPLGRAFLNRFQGGFPLTERPFHEAAQALNSDEETLIATLGDMLDQGFLSRFGPLFDAERLGGCFTLAAMAVPEPQFDQITGVLDSLPEVAHNYRRDHVLNMWFVLATESPAELQQCVSRIQSMTGLVLYDFPKIKEYHVGFWLHLGEDGAIGVRRVERDRPEALPEPDPLDRALIAATQGGLPLVSDPYDVLARDLDCDREALMDRLAYLLEHGAIRRIGAVPNHYRLGLRGNGMTVWDIDDDRVDALGERIGALDFVSHCYRRPRRPPLWPYNLFAMVHGRDRDGVQSDAARIQALVGDHCRAHQVLFSEAVLKKTGLRFKS